MILLKCQGRLFSFLFGSYSLYYPKNKTHKVYLLRIGGGMRFKL